LPSVIANSVNSSGRPSTGIENVLVFFVDWPDHDRDAIADQPLFHEVAAQQHADAQMRWRGWFCCCCW